jgi:DNA-binding LacI/PurR family transcriptional regulator
VEHLYELGHRRIAFISAQYASSLSRVREATFRQEMQRAGLPVSDDTVVHTDWQKRDVIEAKVLELLHRPGPRPTALLCAGDMIAMTAQRAARLCGLSLPRDLSVVGFANFLMATYADPPLTTVAQPFEEIGRLAVRRLLASQDGSESVTGTLEVPTQLVVRLSTTAPPQD